MKILSIIYDGGSRIPGARFARDLLPQNIIKKRCYMIGKILI
ncbi:protein of unknown function [Streptococcus thermophilus]|nr:protein of unknown function [Streptococcus thermophilus]